MYNLLINILSRQVYKHFEIMKHKFMLLCKPGQK